MSTLATPLIQNTVPAPVVRVIRQGDSANYISSYYRDDARSEPMDISDWRVTVVELERLLCRYVDAGPQIEGPYAPFAAPSDPAGATARDFAVTQPGALTDRGVPNAWAVRYPANAWPWPIPAVGRLATTPLLVVRVRLDLPGGIVQRRPFALAIISSDTAGGG